MASEPFEATDANGITVTGTVDVFRDPNGHFFKPGSQYYRNPRYAERNFDYFNPREACKIDRDTLSRAMQKALRNALIRFGIPGPNDDRIEEDVNKSIAAMRQRCIQNADKYVSNGRW
jgi:hypothetical protein